MEKNTYQIEHEVTEFLTGGGEIGKRIKDFNWSETSIGPMRSWPQSLRSALGICINSNFPIAIYWGEDLTLIYNEAWSPIPGNKHPWALGRPAKEVWPEIWEDIEPLFREAFQTGKATGSNDGLLPMERHGYVEECYFNFTFTPIYGESGKVEGIFNAVIETTYRVISERRTSLLQRLNAGINNLVSVTEVLQRAHEILASAKHDIPFFEIYTSVPGKDPVLFSSSLDQATKLQPWPFRDISKNSYLIIDQLHLFLSKIPVGHWPESPKQAIIIPMKGSDGGTTGFVIFGISPRRKFDSEYQLFFENITSAISGELNTIRSLDEEKKRSEALEQIDKAKTAFFSNISHEFRTPLTLLLAPIEDLLNDPDIKDVNREKMSVAFRNAFRLQKLVNLLLDFSRIEAGRMEANFIAVDITSLTEDLASNFRSAIERAGMELIISTEPIAEPVYVDVDMWEKIILNLLSNAFKYTEAGSIEVLVSRKGTSVEIAVKDTGIGIPEGEIDKIFERFHRVQSTGGRSQEGTGIGLAMVKELVKLQGGTISVRSKVGEGSTFTISMPLGEVRELQTLRPSKNTLSTSSRSSPYIEEANQWLPESVSTTTEQGRTSDLKTAKHYTVLLADDNADMRKYVLRLLDSEYHVVLAEDGEEAFSKTLQYSPDLILSDVMMPKLDGFGLLKKLKSNLSTRNIPVVFLSARAGEESKVDGLSAGADDYLVKPFSSKELLARINNHIASSVASRKTEREFFNLFLQSPAHIHVFKGPEHVVEFFHPLGVRFIGKDITGMKIREALPQLEGQAFFEMLDKVYQEGVTIRSQNSKAVLPAEDGSPKEFYFDITYLPWRDINGKVQGVLQFTFEVTETIQQRLRAEFNEKRFRSIAQQAPVAMALLMGPSHVVEVANDRVLEMWGKNYEEVINKPVLEIFPEIIEQGLGAILANVLKTGEPFIASELPVTFIRRGYSKEMYVNLLYEPFRNENNEIVGVVAIGTEVTEQVMARNKVAEAELKFRTIIEQTPSPLCIFKGEDMILEVANDAALAVWQVGREVIGKRLVEIVPEMARQPFLELMLDVYKNGVTRHGYEAPAYFIREDGMKEERAFNFIYVPFRDVNESIVGVLVLATDVTEQMQAKKQLVENEERLRIAVEILQLGTWEYDTVNDVLYCSDRTVELFGFTRGEKINLAKALSAIVDEDRERVAGAIRWALNPASGGKYNVEYSLINLIDKSLRTIRASGQAFFDARALPTRFIGTALDITERKKAEQEIKASEARFRMLATSIPQIVWTSDSEGNTTFISHQFEKFTGQKPEESLQLWGTLIHPDDKKRLFSKRNEAIQNGHGWQEEFRLKDTNTDVYRWFLGNAQPLKDPNGNIMVWIGSASDIQDLKEQSNWLEQQIQERTKALKELNQSLKVSNEDLQQFAHVASHDLKEPIRKIKTYSHRLQDDYKVLLPEKGNNFLNKILSATDRIYSMIDGVLSYSTMASVDQPTEVVDLNGILENIQNDLEVLILEKNAKITADRLPSIEGAPVLLYQLFYNLINNSIKFAKAGVRPEINIHASKINIENKEFAKIVLADNGIGFEQEYAERIFTTFTRLNSKDKYEGTGLGLALCKKIVQRHGGFISARGARNEGAEFTVLLPAIA